MSRGPIHSKHCATPPIHFRSYAAPKIITSRKSRQVISRHCLWNFYRYSSRHFNEISEVPPGFRLQISSRILLRMSLGIPPGIFPIISPGIHPEVQYKDIFMNIFRVSRKNYFRKYLFRSMSFFPFNFLITLLLLAKYCLKNATIVLAILLGISIRFLLRISL